MIIQSGATMTQNGPFKLYNPFSGEFSEAETLMELRRLKSSDPNLVEVYPDVQGHVIENGALQAPQEVSEETFLLNTLMVSTMKVVRREEYVLVVGEAVVGSVHTMFFHDRVRNRFLHAQELASKSVDELVRIFLTS